MYAYIIDVYSSTILYKYENPKMPSPKKNANDVISTLKNSNEVAKTRKFVPRTPEIKNVPGKAPALFAKTTHMLLIIYLNKLFHYFSQLFVN